MIKKLVVLGASLLFLSLISLKTNAQEAIIFGERITDYSSDITVNDDGSIDVIERITVNSERQSINHGIYRDFPTIYSKFFVFRDVIDLKVDTVKRNGVKEPYVIESISGGKRIKIGSSSILIGRGIHKYELRYSVSEQVRYFDDHDELFYNITGNDWAFPIDNISADIHLPFELKDDDFNAYGYTGYVGDEGKKYSVDTISGKDTTTIRYNSTVSFNVGEGLTAVIEWPKGNVTDMGEAAVFQDILEDNVFIIIGSSVVFIISIYYLLSWLMMGRDPQGKTIYPQFKPPENISPAQLRYINKMRYDNKAVTASIVNMAVKGAISIKESSKKFTIYKTSDFKGDLSNEETTLIEKLFHRDPNIFNLVLFGKQIFSNKTRAVTRSSVAFKPTNSHIIQPAIAHFKSDLKDSVLNVYFKNNSKYLWPGLLLYLFGFCAVLLQYFINGDFSIMGYIFMVAFWNGITYLFVFAAMIPAWLLFFSERSCSKLVGAIFITLFMTPFIVIGVVMLFSPIEDTQPLTPLGMFAVFVPIPMHVYYYFALKARTIKGKKIQDAIDGFKMFLETAEEKRIEFMHRELPLTLDNYERYLPYAIALDIEAKWADLFSATLEQLKTNNQSPTWYTGSSIPFSSSSFSSSMSSALSSSVSSSSSSGSSGGSGGGGGGGGGGGW